MEKKIEYYKDIVQMIHIDYFKNDLNVLTESEVKEKYKELIKMIKSFVMYVIDYDVVNDYIKNVGDDEIDLLKIYMMKFYGYKVWFYNEFSLFEEYFEGKGMMIRFLFFRRLFIETFKELCDDLLDEDKMMAYFFMFNNKGIETIYFSILHTVYRIQPSLLNIFEGSSFHPVKNTVTPLSSRITNQIEEYYMKGYVNKDIKIKTEKFKRYQMIKKLSKKNNIEFEDVIKFKM